MSRGMSVNVLGLGREEGCEGQEGRRAGKARVRGVGECSYVMAKFSSIPEQASDVLKFELAEQRPFGKGHVLFGSNSLGPWYRRLWETARNLGRPGLTGEFCLP